MSEPAVIDLLNACRPGDGIRRHFGDAPHDKWRAITGAAIVQAVPGVLLDRLSHNQLGDAIPRDCHAMLTGAARAVAMRNLRRLAALGEVLTAFSAAGIPVVVLKGAYLAGQIYRDQSMRQMVDIDLLVRPADLTATVGELQRLGFRGDQPVLPGDRETGKHLGPMSRAGVGAVEVHWRLTPPGQSYSIDPSELWERAVPVTFSGSPALGLSVEDLILHIAFHAAFDHQFGQGVRPLIDLAQITRNGDAKIDWTVVASRGQRWGWWRGVYLAILLAKELAGAAVPQAFLNETEPAGFSDELRSIVIQQVTALGARVPVRRTVTALLEQRRLIDKLSYGLGRLLPPPRARAREFDVSIASWRFSVLYASEVYRRVYRHAPRLSNWITRRDPSFKAYADNQNRLYGWVTEETTRVLPDVSAP